MKVIGVSGSPIPNSNTDRAVQAALKATGVDSEFVKLADYSVAPCRACLGCLRTNRCVMNDDGVMLAEKVKQADALIVGGYTSYSSLDARTKAFLERLYPLRHVHGFMRGKPGAAIITTCMPAGDTALPPAGEMGANAVMFYMAEEGMNFAGSVKIMGNPPCIKCGRGDTCEMSGVKMLYGETATVASVGVNTFECQPDAIAAVRDLGEKIGKMLAGK